MQVAVPSLILNPCSGTVSPPWTPWSKMSTMEKVPLQAHGITDKCISSSENTKEDLDDLQTFLSFLSQSPDYVYIREKSLRLCERQPHIDL